ncbi:DUF3192 domain-containing protein [Arsukibacterium indicum]|uniref:DUF3192 domain-containing protein n=1 Tax=Arsukibacterium indicum TaxID=2848612 RepID=A0ABS6MHG7_9GAMM|nr:DUF3192 domain-containing protein [Arsukibacterium indicum]MBV2128242.1 DUF3192 domain-containing protein [Arsukibacterium indicum]
MNIKPVLLFFGGFAVYALLTVSVLLFYKDDPAQMTWQHRDSFNAKVIGRYKLSDNHTQDDVTARLGGPDITEAVQLNGQVYQLMFYRTQRKLPDGITTEDECTALLFVNRRLVAIGDIAVSQYQQYVNNGNS